MRFSHNAKIFRGQLDVAPFASVTFILLIFLLLQSGLVFTPGIPIQLPQGGNLPGSANPKVSIAVDSGGIVYYQSQITPLEKLRELLRAEASRSNEPLTLVIQADKQVRFDTLIRLAALAREARMSEVYLATRPNVEPSPLLRFQ
jgi:biopolymer transport protein ExbD